MQEPRLQSCAGFSAHSFARTAVGKLRRPRGEPAGGGDGGHATSRPRDAAMAVSQQAWPLLGGHCPPALESYIERRAVPALRSAASRSRFPSARSRLQAKAGHLTASVTMRLRMMLTRRRVFVSRRCQSCAANIPDPQPSRQSASGTPWQLDCSQLPGQQLLVHPKAQNPLATRRCQPIPCMRFPARHRRQLLA